MNLQEIPIASIRPDYSANSRKMISEHELEPLVQSLKDIGQRMPIEVTLREDGSYAIVAGYRRYRAVLRLGWPTIKAIVTDVREKSRDHWKHNLAENCCRKPITIIEEAETIANHLLGGEHTPEQVAQEMGKPLVWVDQRYKIAKLPEEVKIAIQTEKLNEKQATALTLLRSEEEQLKMAAKYQEANNRREKETEREVEKVTETARARSKTEIEALIDLLFEEPECNVPELVLRVLAWAAGNIKTEELNQTLSKIGIREYEEI